MPLLLAICHMAAEGSRNTAEEALPVQPDDLSNTRNVWTRDTHGSFGVHEMFCQTVVILLPSDELWHTHLMCFFAPNPAAAGVDASGA